MNWKRWAIVQSILLVCSLVHSAEQNSSSEASSEELFKKYQKHLEVLKELAEKGGHPNPSSITEFDETVCYTYVCIEAAKEFMFATNFKEDPCNGTNEWLRYTCVRRTLQGESEEDEFSDMYQQSQVGYLGSVALGQSLVILEPGKSDLLAMKNAVTYYEQCEKWRQRTDNDSQVDAIRNYLDIFGDWPLLTGGNTPGDKFDWKTMMSNVVRIAVTYGVAPYLFDIFIEDGNIPLIFTGELTLHKENSEIGEIIKIMSKGERIIDENNEQLKEMRDFMAKLTYPTEENIESYQIKNITDNNDFDENFDLADFIKQMMNGTEVEVSSDSIVAADVDWLVNHTRAINGANPRIIANILFLQTVAALLTRLTTLTHGDHLTSLQKYRSEGQLDCLRETYEKFDYAMSHAFIAKYYNPAATPILIGIVENLKKGYAETIQHAEFLSSQTKVHAIDKAKNIHTFIASDAWVMNETLINDYYKNMHVSKKNSFVENHVAGLRFQWEKFLELSNPNIFNFLVGDAYTGFIGAMYSHYFNQLRIQAALVQKPLFDPEYPGFMNYAGIGTVISHELGHSFDTNGIHFNKRGERGDFWDDVSYESYYNWTDSLIEDYNNASYKGKEDPWGSLSNANIDHSQAINDDIADIVGVRMAYFAYQIYLADLKKKNKNEVILPGLKDFSPEKLFWMKYANMWCEHTDKSYLHALRHFSTHSPGNIRATFPIPRSAEWAKDFGCPAPQKTEF